MSLIDWELFTERAVGRGSPTYPDVANRPLREVLTVSGYDPDQDFAGFAKATHTHDASAIASGTLAPARGGTGVSSPQAGALLVAAAAAAMTVLAPGASGQVVKSNGAAWTAAALVTADISDATSLNTVSTAVKRDASGNFAAGTITAALAGNASTATALATPRTINGVAFDGSGNIVVKATATNLLSMGAHLTGVAYDGSAPITIATDATSANTSSTIVARDASGNFSAGTITASFTGALTGVASLAAQLATPRAINGVNFDGSAAVTVKASTTNALTFGTHVTGAASFDGSAGVTIATDATAANTPSTIVARDPSGNFIANIITATLAGNASSATTATTATTAATVTNAAQPTITSLGTLTALAVSGITTGSGGFTSAKGALVTATGIFATAFTPSVAGRYSVAWTLEGFGSSSIYSGVAEIIYDGATAYLMSLTVGSTTTAQLAGGAFQIKQSSGTPQTMNWTFVFIPF